VLQPSLHVVFEVHPGRGAHPTLASLAMDPPMPACPPLPPWPRPPWPPAPEVTEPEVPEPLVAPIRLLPELDVAALLEPTVPPVAADALAPPEPEASISSLATKLPPQPTMQPKASPNDISVKKRMATFLIDPPAGSIDPR
jgi:hypothetical protein